MPKVHVYAAEDYPVYCITNDASEAETEIELTDAELAAFRKAESNYHDAQRLVEQRYDEANERERNRVDHLNGNIRAEPVKKARKSCQLKTL